MPAAPFRSVVSRYAAGKYRRAAIRRIRSDITVVLRPCRALDELNGIAEIFIDMRQIAPTLARLLGLTLPAASAAHLRVEAE